MLLYQDIIPNINDSGIEQDGDEMFSDAFPIKLVDDIVYEVDCSMITFKEGDVDIGANPSADEAAEALEDGAKTVNNVVHSFRLEPTSFTLADYKTYIKGYMKRVRQKLPEDEIKAFEKGASVFIKKVLDKKNFEQYEFFTGESRNVDGMVVLLNYREDGITPYLTYWKHGLKVVKL